MSSFNSCVWKINEFYTLKLKKKIIIIKKKFEVIVIFNEEFLFLLICYEIIVNIAFLFYLLLNIWDLNNTHVSTRISLWVKI